MRTLRSFIVHEVASTAEISIANVRKYLRALVAFGYVRIVTARKSGFLHGYQVYHLVRNTGPLRPLLRKDGSLYDQNTGQTFRLTSSGLVVEDGLVRGVAGSLPEKLASESSDEAGGVNSSH